MLHAFLLDGEAHELWLGRSREAIACMPAAGEFPWSYWSAADTLTN